VQIRILSSGEQRVEPFFSSGPEHGASERLLRFAVADGLPQSVGQESRPEVAGRVTERLSDHLARHSRRRLSKEPEQRRAIASLCRESGRGAEQAHFGSRGPVASEHRQHSFGVGGPAHVAHGVENRFGADARVGLEKTEQRLHSAVAGELSDGVGRGPFEVDRRRRLQELRERWDGLCGSLGGQPVQAVDRLAAPFDRLRRVFEEAHDEPKALLAPRDHERVGEVAEEVAVGGCEPAAEVIELLAGE
jgi:hypothetical protein